MNLGDRMKNYENVFRQYLPIRTNVIIRVDGRAFHSVTRQMNRPFDNTFIRVMNLTALEMCKEIQNCRFAYVQSDEISFLMTDFTEKNTAPWFDNNIQKICSISASMATLQFNNFASLYSAWRVNDAMFDSRVFMIPSSIEIENYFIWRQMDASRNSVQMVARSLYSHKECENKNNSELQEMIHQKGQNWNDYPVRCKRGGFIHYVKREITEEQHKILEEYHKNPIGDAPQIERSSWEYIDPPIFTQDREFLRNRIPA